jgi:hypothetical protein
VFPHKGRAGLTGSIEITKSHEDMQSAKVCRKSLTYFDKYSGDRGKRLKSNDAYFLSTWSDTYFSLYRK